MTQKVKKSFVVRASVTVLIALLFMVGLNWALVALAAIGQGDIRVRVGTEISAAGTLKGNAKVSIRCAGGSGDYVVTDQTASDSNTTPGIVDIASTAVGFTAAGQANCDTQSEWLAASVSLDGFVTASISHSLGNKYTKTIAADTPNSGVASLSFTLHVNGVEDELGNVLTLDGTSASISYSGGTATVSYSGGKAYLSISPSDTSPMASAGFNGYVNKQKLLTSTAISSTASLSAYFGTGGGSVTYTGSGLPFAYKFTVYPKGDTSTISGASVTAGNSGTVNCKESGSTGIYYCAVPPSHTSVTATAAKTGYNAGSLTYTLRSNNHAAQLTGSIYPIGSGGGGGGQVYTLVFGTPTPTPTPTSTPTPNPTPGVSVTPTPLATVQPTPSVSVMPSVSAKLFRKAHDPKVYVQGDDGLLRWVKTLEEFNAAGYNWSDVKIITGKDFAKMVVASKLRVKNGVKLNVRDSASLKGKIIGRILSGDLFDKKDTSGAWFKITLPSGQDGWIYSKYVSEE